MVTPALSEGGDQLAYVRPLDPETCFDMRPSISVRSAKWKINGWARVQGRKII